MPTYSTSSNYVSEVSDVLNEISGILSQHHINNFVIGWDFNVTLKEDNAVVSRFLNPFLKRESLKCAMESTNQSINFKFESKANGSRSTLDHVVVISNIFNSICSYHVRHDGDNVSDRSPVCMSLKIDISKVADSFENEHICKYLWQRSTDLELVKYKSTLDECLNNICVPWELIYCSNVFCTDHNKLIDKF